MASAPQVVHVTPTGNPCQATLHFHNGRRKTVWWTTEAIGELRAILVEGGAGRA